MKNNAAAAKKFGQEIQKLEVKEETINKLEEIINKLDEVQQLVESLSAQLESAKIEQGKLTDELLEMYELSDENAKWLLETKNRLVKISSWIQQKAVPYKKMFELVYSKLAPQIQRVVDKELTALKETAGQTRRVTVQILKKEGSLWSAIQKGWDKVKDYVGGLINKMVDSLRNLLTGKEEINATIDEMEQLAASATEKAAHEDYHNDSGCEELLSRYGLKADCSDEKVNLLATKVAALGETNAERVLKEKYIKQLQKMSQHLEDTYTIIGIKKTDEDKVAEILENNEIDMFYLLRNYSKDKIFVGFKTTNKDKVVSLLEDEGIYFATGFVNEMKDSAETGDVDAGVDDVDADDIDGVEVRVLSSKQISIDGTVVKGSTEEETLAKALDMIQKKCGCEREAERILQRAVRSYVIKKGGQDG